MPNQVILLVLGGLMLTRVTSADDPWSRFRGPNGSGVSDGVSLPAQLEMAEHLRWKTPLSGGHSSPVLGAGRIFLTAAEGEQLLTVCLDQADGKVLWRAEAPRARKEKLDPRNHPASPSAAVDDHSVYVFFADFGLLCYSHDGHKRWQLPLGPFDNIYGMGASPIVVDNLVVLACDQSTGSYLLAVDKQKGEPVWKADRPEATSGHCSPIVRQTSDGPEIILPGSFFLTAYDAATGNKRWWVGGLCFEMKSTPVMDDGTIYINGYGSPANQPGQEVEVATFQRAIATQDNNGDGEISRDEMTDRLGRSFFPALDLDASGAMNREEWDYYRAAMASKNSMMAIRAGGSGDVTDQNVRWRYHRNIPQLPSPILYNQHLFMISDQGIVTCFDPRTGEALNRRRLTDTSGSIYASPIACDGKLVFVTEAGKIAMMRPDKDLEVLGVTELGQRCYATPALGGGKIYLRTETALYAFGSKTQRQ